MCRYFIEVAYKGTRYSGFQVQQNALTIQSEVEQAFTTIQRQPVSLTGSSRTDAGVHALQNYFHFDAAYDLHPQLVYKMNALLPPDIVVKALHAMPDEAHSRFDATARAYKYRIYQYKNPFLKGLGYYYPYKLNFELMQRGAAIVKEQTNFFAFSKTNTQVKNFNCKIAHSYWEQKPHDVYIYNIEGNRFLRGMVRLLTASLLKIGREQLSLEAFESFFKTEGKCGFSVPADGLFLKAVKYPDNYFTVPKQHVAAHPKNV